MMKREYQSRKERKVWSTWMDSWDGWFGFSKIQVGMGEPPPKKIQFSCGASLINNTLTNMEL